MILINVFKSTLYGYFESAATKSIWPYMNPSKANLMKKSIQGFTLFLAILTSHLTLAQGNSGQSNAINSASLNSGASTVTSLVSLNYDRLIKQSGISILNGSYLNLDESSTNVKNGFVFKPSKISLVRNNNPFGISGKGNSDFKSGLSVPFDVGSGFGFKYEKGAFILPNVILGYKFQKGNGFRYRAGISVPRGVSVASGCNFYNPH